MVTEDTEWQPKVYVRLYCTYALVEESEVEFENIEEDMQGRDVLTFKCPECGKSHTSHRLT